MNQKDYKAIAKIMNSNLGSMSLKSQHEHRIRRLADYFEKETECERCCWTRENHKRFGCELNGKEFKPLFNKKQFLKDCGVEE